MYEICYGVTQIVNELDTDRTDIFPRTGHGLRAYRI
jgi:hypothetical protein